jgi:hypothetical protein
MAYLDDENEVSRGAPSAGQHREPGGRQIRSPGREPWDRANHRIDWLPAKGAFFYLGGPPNGRKSALGRAVGKGVGCRSQGFRFALALGYGSAALRAGLDAFKPRTRTDAAPVFGPRRSGELVSRKSKESVRRRCAKPT